MFFKTIIKQRTKIHDLERQLQQEKENSSNLRKEAIGKNLELRKYRQFRDKIILVMSKKGTIVDKYDKIKELVDNLHTEN